jgi:Rieske Fe-S protein
MSDIDAPKWRLDFPLTSEGEEEVTRREFVRYLVLASGTFAAGSVGIAAWNSLRPINRGEARPIIALEKLAAGSAFLFRYPTEADPAILVHLATGDLRAFSQKCPHLGCVVTWNRKDSRLLCPCHDGAFEPQDGRPLAGPPQLPLDRIEIEARPDGMIWATAGGQI